MDILVLASNINEALNKLTLQDLQAILLQEGESIQGNSHVLRARIKRLVFARRNPGSLQFPPPPVSIEQTSFSDQINQISGINVGARSTMNIENPPLPEENLNISNISPIATELNNNAGSATVIMSTNSPCFSTIETTSTSSCFTTITTNVTPTVTSSRVSIQPGLTQPIANMYNSANFSGFGQNLLPFQQTLSTNPVTSLQNSAFFPNQQNMYEMFTNFMMFMQFMNIQNYGSVPQIPITPVQTTLSSSIGSSQPSTVNSNKTQQHSANVPLVAQPVTSLPANLENLMDQNLNLVFSEHQNPTRYNVDIKRISYISSTFEKRKTFFSGKTGNDPNRFIKYLEESGKFMGLSDNELFCTLPVVLKDEALEWFRLEEGNFPDFTAFRTAFLVHYNIPYYQDRLMEEVRQRTQALRENITSFVTCVRIIFDKMNPKLSLSRQLDIACQNLNPTYSMQINRSQINNFDDLLCAGKQVEVKLINMQKYKEPPPADNAVLANAAWHPPRDQKQAQQPRKQQKPNVEKKNEIASAKEIPASDKNTVQKKKTSPTKEKKFTISANTVRVNTVENKSPEPRINEEKFPEMPRPGECFKCRQSGHIFKSCTNDPVFKIFCFSCGRAKTIAPKCPTCKKEGEGNVKRDQPR